jgi:hypothetical protein
LRYDEKTIQLIRNQMHSLKIMVPETGIEPVTRGFSIRCSTN